MAPPQPYNSAWSFSQQEWDQTPPTVQTYFVTMQQFKVAQDLMKATIGIFLGVALGLKTEVLKSFLTSANATPAQPFWNNPEVLLTLVFFFTWFSFFLGTNFYMSQAPASRDAWRIDLTATIVTLCIIVLLGAMANTSTRDAFLGWLCILYVFEFAWEWIQPALILEKDRRTKVPLFWYVADPLLALFTGLYWLFSSLPLEWLVFVHCCYTVMNLFKLT